MKKFTIITKDGSKWLRPVNPYRPYGRQESIHDSFKRENPDVPYLGNKPEGTTLDESDVIEVRQYQYEGEWFDCYNDVFYVSMERHPDIATRTAYTDAESHDTSNDNPRYPLFSHMSSEHGLTLLDSELDEIARHASPMTGVEYWKRRSKISESMIGMCPSDPKTYDEFCRLYDEWEQIIEEGRAYGN